MTNLPLAGIRVVDLTVVWAGPYATMFLGDLGAEVIRVENPWIFPSSTRGYMARPTKAVARAMGPVGGGYPDYEPGDRPWNRHVLFTSHARNKLSMTLDLRKPSGRELLLRLIDKSDLVIENNSAGFLEKFDLGWDVLNARNPRASLIRMPPVGLSGPYRDYVGFGANFEALSGLTSLRGYPGSDPTERNITAYMDAASGSAAAFAALLAIRRQRRDNVGSCIELSQTENMLQTIGEHLIAAADGERDRGPMGNRHPCHAPQGAYPCAGDDHWVVISVESDEQWQALRQILGEPAWAMDHSLDSAEGRSKLHDLVDEGLSDWTSGQDRYGVFHQCQAVGVPAAPVLNEADAFDDPHLAARGYFQPLSSEEIGRHLYPGHSFKWSGPPLAWERAAPSLGGDNDYVYRNILGLTDAEYAAVRADGHLSLDYLDEHGNPL